MYVGPNYRQKEEKRGSHKARWIVTKELTGSCERWDFRRFHAS